MGAGILKVLLEERSIPGQVSSAGLYAVEGSPASPLAIEAMAERGIDLSSHRARRVNVQILMEATHIVGVNGNHVETLMSQYPEQSCRIRTFPLLDIPDPFGFGLDTYRIVRDLLFDWCYGLLDYISD
jgi:protein-tyrosine phosphatase